ncbi:MAG: hypothetical protein AAFX00_11070, partial [Pseudomonadota bacterium]
MVAQTAAAHSGADLARLLLARGLVSEPDLMRAQAHRWRARVANLDKHPPDARLVDQIGIPFCLREGLVPWHKVGAATVVATWRPDRLEELKKRGTLDLGPVIIAIASQEAVERAIVAAKPRRLVAEAETKVESAFSCRNWPVSQVGTFAPTVALIAVALAFLLPTLLAFGVVFWSLLTLIAVTTLKVVAAVLYLRMRHTKSDSPPPTVLR